MVTLARPASRCSEFETSPLASSVPTDALASGPRSGRLREWQPCGNRRLLTLRQPAGTRSWSINHSAPAARLRVRALQKPGIAVSQLVTLMPLMTSIGVLLEDVADRDSADAWMRRHHGFCRRLTRLQTPDALHALLLRTMGDEVDARVASLALYSDVDRTLSVVATRGYPQEIVDHLRITPGEGVLGAVFRTGHAVATTAAATDQPRRLRYRSNSYAAVPLKADGRVLGVAAFTDRRDGQAFDLHALKRLRLLAGPAGLALAMERLRATTAEITRLASIDALTGLFNRRHFDARLEAELQRARRRGEPLTLLMLDIDNFKTINDVHGHVVGDRLLRCVADRLRRGVRIFDVCARYGGDEFAILMPSTPIETALLVAERIRVSVRAHCAHAGSTVTVSTGIAHVAGEYHDLVSIADQALLEAKAMGKNAVRVKETDE